MPESTRTQIPARILRFTLRHLGEIVLVFGVAVIVGLSAFAYRMLYRTFTDAQAIAILRTQVAVEDFDRDRFERVQRSIETRKARSLLPTTTLRDPFAFPAPTGETFRQPSHPPSRP